MSIYDPLLPDPTTMELWSAAEVLPLAVQRLDLVVFAEAWELTTCLALLPCRI